MADVNMSQDQPHVLHWMMSGMGQPREWKQKWLLVSLLAMDVFYFYVVLDITAIIYNVFDTICILSEKIRIESEEQESANILQYIGT